MALVKPIEVVVLVIHILARIAGGATVNDLMSGDLFRRPENRRRGSSFPDQRSPARRAPGHGDDNDGEGDSEDDYGVPIRGRARSEDLLETTESLAVSQNPESEADLLRKRKAAPGGSVWDLD